LSQVPVQGSLPTIIDTFIYDSNNHRNTYALNIDGLIKSGFFCSIVSNGPDSRFITEGRNAGISSALPRARREFFSANRLTVVLRPNCRSSGAVAGQ
jgi:hypothetical protein